MERIGLVAGGGSLPLIFAAEAKRQGVQVTGFGLTGTTSEELTPLVDKMHWFEWGQLKKAIMTVTFSGVRQIVFLGKIKKATFFTDEKALDEESRRITETAKGGGKSDYTILKGIEQAFKLVGIRIVSPIQYLGSCVPEKGVLTGRAPTKEELADIEIGRVTARELARLDIGQTVCIKDKCVIALEGAEGTDDTIRRASALTGGGFTVVKMARPDQDMRFDVPLIGVDTIKVLIGSKGAVLALEEKRTILIEREEVIRLADQAGISIAII